MFTEEKDLNEELKAFKNELKNYNFYKQRIKSLQEMIDTCYDMLSGVKAIDYSKEPSHTPPNKDIEYRIRDEIEKYKLFQARTQIKLDDINRILNKVESSLREAIIESYCNGKTLEKVAEKRFISKVGLFKQINVALKEALAKD